ncbi:MAG: pilin [bacterium]|nr:pilin [bacterium]
MKKILMFVVIFSFLIGLSGVALAQSDLNECCKVTNKIEGVGSTPINGTAATPIFVGPTVASGAAAPTCLLATGGTQVASVVGVESWGMVCLLNTVYTVTNWIFYLLTILAVLMIIYGGFVYITAAGDPAKATSAKGILTFAIIGLAIALLAKFIPSLVRFILGV